MVFENAGHTLWYVAVYEQQWIALLSFSAAALKCGVRDRWIGWDFRKQYGRLKLIANNSRFLILPEWHLPNLGSKVLSLCCQRIAGDWQKQFAHPLLLVETFCDPTRFHGTVYRAANWLCLGLTQGFRRTREGYSAQSQTRKLVFVYPLCPHVPAKLAQPVLDPVHETLKTPKIMLSAQQTRTLPSFFADIPDPRTAAGRRHRLGTVLSIAAAATLCGMRGYKAISGWANDLGQKARERFECRREQGRYVVPSRSTIRDVLTRVDPEALDKALQAWNRAFGEEDQCLAIDGKTMCNAVDEAGHQAHIMSVVGHNNAVCHTQKK